MSVCEAITKKNQRCKNKALQGSKFCYCHKNSKNYTQPQNGEGFIDFLKDLSNLGDSVKRGIIKNAVSDVPVIGNLLGKVADNLKNDSSNPFNAISSSDFKDVGKAALIYGKKGVMGKGVKRRQKAALKK